MRFIKISGCMFVAGLIAMVVVVAGCGGDANVGYVTGRMTLDGEPVPAGVKIGFLPSAPGISTVMFEVRSDSEDTGRDQPKFKIPRKYQDNYGQEITVKPGKQVINLELTSD